MSTTAAIQRKGHRKRDRYRKREIKKYSLVPDSINAIRYVQRHSTEMPNCRRPRIKILKQGTSKAYLYKEDILVMRDNWRRIEMLPNVLFKEILKNFKKIRS